ncbi:hypothetical protein VTN31DRAFT_664 [Thermomyces dupontii]|uniref:uncharacterized protein n=1 Tax=Talaromyces thermophilus TaxID=28565 RepID=UPI0037421B1C
MAPPPPSGEDHQRLLEKLDIALVPRPFRNPQWKPSQRRNKNVKQLLSDSSRREASSMATQNNSGVTTPYAPGTTDGTQTPAVEGAASRGTNISQAAQDLSTLALENSLKASTSRFASGPAVTYTNIESAPSLHPAQQRRYCDITGLPAPYLDPKTRLRYHNQEIFGVVRNLPQGAADSYLEVRGAHIVLK